ncbi:MAG: septum formation initiator family protein [Candidatus Nomurabacteria bacterium]|jgi:hypothetical protein|nr:septum formation initiator family protein [Candidatus Nomurabacteria bacterium]
MENDSIVSCSKNKFKPLAIVFIVLSVLLAISTGIFVWQYFSQRAEISDLNAKIEKLIYENANHEDSLQAAEVEQSQKDPNIVTVDELTAAYEAAGHNLNNSFVILNDDYEIKDGSIKPYQTVTATIASRSGVGSAAGHFYRAGVDDDWHYGFGAQNAGLCNRFSNWPVFDKAFADFPCFDDMDAQTTYGEYATGLGII